MVFERGLLFFHAADVGHAGTNMKGAAELVQLTIGTAGVDFNAAVIKIARPAP